MTTEPFWSSTVMQSWLRRLSSSELMGRRRRHTLIGSIWAGSSMKMEVVVRRGGAIFVGGCICVFTSSQDFSVCVILDIGALSGHAVIKRARTIIGI